MKVVASLALLLATTALPLSAQAADIFPPGNLVVSVEGRGDPTDPHTYTDNQAAPLTLYSFSHNGTTSATMTGYQVLPSTISGEYGSSSEGQIQLTGDGKHLVIMGYGVNAATFNANPGAYSASPTNKALGQSGSQLGQNYTAVPRVVAVVGANGSADTSTSVFGVFDGNNPRSVASADGTSFYISGQGTSPDGTGGVFLTTLGSHSATPITGNDTLSSSAKKAPASTQDSRIVEIYNNQLYVSVDSKEGSGNARSFIGTLGGPNSLPTGVTTGGTGPGNTGPAMLPGFGNTGGTGKITITSQTVNGANAIGDEVNLSPEDYFFANATTLYVADSGDGKQTSADSSLGDGGLQKWTLGSNGWQLDYTLSDGLDLVANTATDGTTGLLGLTGEVVNGEVELFATNYTAGDTDQTYLYGITDLLSATTLGARDTSGTFQQLAEAPADANFKGVSFAPIAAAVPEPASWALLIAGFGLTGGLLRRRRGQSALA
jgi:PEP-CTERM motif